MDIKWIMKLAVMKNALGAKMPFGHARPFMRLRYSGSHSSGPNRISGLAQNRNHYFRYPDIKPCRGISALSQVYPIINGMPGGVAE